MLKRKRESHKGDNGKVMIVGGSPMFHGAPILSSLAAEYSGVDLVFPFIPKMHAEVARGYSLNFIIQTFEDEILTNKDVKTILNLSEKMDAIVIGPGLGTNPKTKKALEALYKNLKVPTVIDASGLLYTNHYPKQAILTPHQGEFTALTGDDPTPDNVQKWAKDLGVTIVCKGSEDIIADSDELAINKTGTPLMTVGGTGDVLSGLIGGLVAQKMTLFEAGQQATELLGRAGEGLEKVYGSLRAIDLVHSIPTLLK